MVTVENIKWEDRAVTVTAHLVPRYIWTTASIDAFLGDECILRTGGQMKIVSTYAETFFHAGSQHTAELTWGVGLLWSFPYMLRIDGVQIDKGRVRVRNWPIGLAVMAVMWFILAILTVAMIFMFRHFLAGLPH